MTDAPVPLTGTVVSVDGWPLPGVPLTVLGAAGGQVDRAVTDPAGSFTLQVPAVAESRTLVVVAPGAPPYVRQLPAQSTRGADLGRIVVGEPAANRSPRPGRWDIDPAHSIVKATARHLGLTRVEGRFVDLAGHLDIGADLLDSSVEVIIAATSLTTGNADRDAHLKSADFLGVQEFPNLSFTSTGLRRGDGDRWWVDGLLTIRDIQHPVALDMSYAGSGPDPWGGTRAAFVASTQLNRRDFEMNWNMGLPGGMLLVGSSLRVDLDVQAVLVE
jgi:polyisoprenoid-binding protein YceI